MVREEKKSDADARATGSSVTNSAATGATGSAAEVSDSGQSGDAITGAGDAAGDVASSAAEASDSGQSGDAIAGVGDAAGDVASDAAAGATGAGDVAGDVAVDDLPEIDPNATGFDAIPGYSHQDAMTYCGGDEEFVLEMLEDYAGNGRYERIAQFYDAKDWENYRIEVHALKSTSRTVGLNELGGLAEANEHAAKDEDIEFVLSHHGHMMGVYERTLQGIAKCLEE